MWEVAVDPIDLKAVNPMWNSFCEKLARSHTYCQTEIYLQNLAKTNSHNLRRMQFI